jgi:hypothetical protein
MSYRCAVAAAIAAACSSAAAQTPVRWLAHDMERPRPPVVTPGKPPLPAPAPSDAVILFDGVDLSKWRSADGAPAKWVVRDGYMESVPTSGYLFTADAFGDVQLHVEWAAPTPPRGRGQARGNSGVFLMGLYEIQVLDSYQNETYADGQAAAVYGQHPPLVNASLPPGEWQSFDVVFRRPRFHPDGALARPARLTLLHNGVLVQDDVEIWGPTAWLQRMPYTAHPDRLPISLQDHGNPVRYRNIWLRELPDRENFGPPATPNPPLVDLSPDQLRSFVGEYSTILGDFARIQLHDENVLRLHMRTGQVVDLVPRSPTEFALRWTAGKIDFHVVDGVVSGFTLHLGGERIPTSRKKK